MAGSTRTSSAIFLGEKLRTAREGRKISLRKLAELMGRKPSDSGLISRWESGDRVPKADDVAKIVEALGIDADEAAELTALANGTSSSPWLAITLPERRQQINAVLAAERTATTVTHIAPLLIPGVLQTAEIIRAIMIDGEVPADEIDERVNTRIGRRHLITRKNPAQLDVLLGEAAVTQIIGGRPVMADQLRWLLEMMDYPNVDIRVLPRDAGWTPALTGAYVLIDSDEAPSIVSLETHGGGLLLHSREDVATHRQAAEAVRKKAMNSTDTVALITKVLTELENTQ
jgi:transcriptional regulator with XRE-family HTH domain